MVEGFWPSIVVDVVVDLGRDSAFVINEDGAIGQKVQHEEGGREEWECSVRRATQSKAGRDVGREGPSRTDATMLLMKGERGARASVTPAKESSPARCLAWLKQAHHLVLFQLFSAPCA